MDTNQTLSSEEMKRLQVARLHFKDRYTKLWLEHRNERDEERKKIRFERLLKCGAVAFAIEKSVVSYYPADRIRRIIRTGQKLSQEQIVTQYRALYNIEPQNIAVLLWYLRIFGSVKEERKDGNIWFSYDSSLPEESAIIRIGIFPELAFGNIREHWKRIHPQVGTAVATQPRVKLHNPRNKIVEISPPVPKPLSLSENLIMAIGNYQHYAGFVETLQNDLLEVKDEAVLRQSHHMIRRFMQKISNWHRRIQQIEESIEKERQQTGEHRSP